MTKKNIYTLLISLVSVGIFSSCNNEDEGVSFEEQFAIDLDLIDGHLAENSIVSEIHFSGIRFVRNTVGTGDNAEIGDDVAIKYSATFLDGTPLGSDTIGFTFNLSEQIVRAWQFMVPEIQEGGTMTIYSPSGYAFGAQSSSIIPANAIITYEIELLSRVDNADEQLEIDTLIIDEFLAESNLERQVDPSGIRFRVLDEGTGASPGADDNVTVRYEGSFLTGGVFDQNVEGIQFPLQNLIDAWKIMLPQMQEGGMIEIYAPSRFCYGPEGNPAVPPNTILIFEIELVGVAN